MSDIFFVLKWWFFLFGIGLIFLPFTTIIFSRFFDKGYIFSKTLGLITVSYLVFLLGTLHILPFGRLTIIVILLVSLLSSLLFLKKLPIRLGKKDLTLFLFQELMFLSCLIFWSYIKGFQPDIHGLEKFMDFGFMNSILRSSYFPPTDMWFPPFSINYYYFGHLVTALLIKLTNIPAYISFNLMIATIFAFTATSAFSIVSTLTQEILKKIRTSFVTGILGALIVTLGGNLHTLYTLFVPYSPPENPVPFYLLKFSPFTFPNNYWYPNATRFIPFTIHEFPSYSFVVSDLHGHVLDIPFVFLTLALMLTIFFTKKISYLTTILIAFMLAVMYMTNAWDGIIYFLLFTMVVIVWNGSILKTKKSKKQSRWFDVMKKIENLSNKTEYILSSIKLLTLAGIGYVIFSLPFNLNFKPFVSGFGVICPPDFLIKLQKIGPIIFEADHCQRTPFWMLIVLYGFFYFFAIALVLKIATLKKPTSSLIYILLLILLSTILIALPEFVYAKDIYPAHYRANTMFKLGYQAFIMLSITSSVAIAYLFHTGKRAIWLPIALVLLSFILMYPYFAITSYFGNLAQYKGLHGLSYLQSLYPDDYDAIMWIQKNIPGQPIILEAQGDSYTDYGRISSNTGLPTPLGWTVHEWLWRGNYSYPQSRLDDIRFLYEGSINQVRNLVKKYNISYVYVGTLEKTKYTGLQEDNFREIGKSVYQNGEVTIYKL